MAVTLRAGATRWVLVLCVVGGLAAYVAASWAVDLAEVSRAITRVSPATWALVLSLSLLNYALRFARWHVYLSGLGHDLPPARHLAIYMAGFALTPTPGKLGEGIRALYLKPFGVGIGRCLSALYAERLLDVMAVSLLAALLFLSPHPGVRSLALIGGAITLLLLIAQHPAAVAFTRDLVRRLRNQRLRALGAKIAAFQSDVTTLLRPRMLAGGLLLGLIAWGAEGVGTFLIAQALGIDVSLWAAMGIYAVAMLAGALSFLPGGLGSAEAAMVALFSMAGAPLPVAVAATLLVRLATLWFAVALGAATWLGLETVGRRPAAPLPATGRKAS